MPSSRSAPGPGRRRRTRGTPRRTPGPRAHSGLAGQRRTGLTTRAAVLGLVVCALVVSAALPLREFLSQRGAIAAAVAAQQAQRARVATLQQQQGQLQDPAYIRSQARLRLHYVLPGETAYVVLGPDGAPALPGPSGTRRATGASESPWYSQLWGSVQAADRPAR